MQTAGYSANSVYVIKKKRNTRAKDTPMSPRALEAEAGRSGVYGCP